MKGFGGGLQQMMKQANQMQLRMKKVQEKLAAQEFPGTAGGGAVTVVVNGETQVLSVKIDPAVFKDGDAEILQDLVRAATNEAVRLAKETSQKEMDKVTGGLPIPGMF